jgi:Cof subfamily protein (haloacid dehalogenase superfamily)
MPFPDERNPRRLAFIDLDGTLLGPDKNVSDENLRALGRLRAAGIQIVIASGRHHRNIKALDPIREAGWVLSSHGSVVRHEPTGELLLEMNLEPERFLELWERARKLGLSLIAYHRDGACVEQSSRWTELYARNSGWVPRVADLRCLTPDGFHKIIWSDDPVRIAAVASAIERDLLGRYQMVLNDPELLEFLAPGANKAAGAMALASRLEIDPAQTFAFGDGTNDVELLSWAGVSVAMAHGRESARLAARFISPPGPPESALARAVELALSI